jgi:hypothetical protein
MAKACRFASDKSFSSDIDHWRSLAAIFHACAIAGFAQWHMGPLDIATLDEQLFVIGLSESEPA